MAAFSLPHVLRFSRQGASFFISSSQRFLQQNYVPILQCKRNLFCQEILGLDGFQRQRLMINDRLGNLREKFIDRMNEVVDEEKQQTIFTDDLKTIIHVAQNDEEVNLMKVMLLRYCKDSSSQQFNQYVFGPVILRLLYTLKKTDLALELFLHESTKRIFNQMASCTILLDLLYESKRYEDVINIYKEINERKLNGYIYPGDCTTIAMASFFAMNTPEALQQCKELMIACNKTNVNISNRGIVFGAMLALNQNDNALALEMITTRSDNFNFVIKNIKGICFARMGRVEDTFPILRSILQHDSPYKNQQMKVFPNMLSEIKSELEKVNDPKMAQQLHLIEQSLKVGAFISDVPLEDFVRQTIVKFRQTQNSFKSRERSFVRGFRSRQKHLSDNQN